MQFQFGVAFNKLKRHLSQADQVDHLGYVNNDIDKTNQQLLVRMKKNKNQVMLKISACLILYHV